MYRLHLYDGILLGHKKEWTLAICNSMGVPEGYYAKQVEQRKPYTV